MPETGSSRLLAALLPSLSLMSKSQSGSEGAFCTAWQCDCQVNPPRHLSVRSHSATSPAATPINIHGTGWGGGGKSKHTTHSSSLNLVTEPITTTALKAMKRTRCQNTKHCLFRRCVAGGTRRAEKCPEFVSGIASFHFEHGPCTLSRMLCISRCGRCCHCSAPGGTAPCLPDISVMPFPGGTLVVQNLAMGF